VWCPLGDKSMEVSCKGSGEWSRVGEDAPAGGESILTGGLCVLGTGVCGAVGRIVGVIGAVGVG
jgi:hypothetical protein